MMLIIHCLLKMFSKSFGHVERCLEGLILSTTWFTCVEMHVTMTTGRPADVWDGATRMFCHTSSSQRLTRIISLRNQVSAVFVVNGVDGLVNTGKLSVCF